VHNRTHGHGAHKGAYGRLRGFVAPHLQACQARAFSRVVIELYDLIEVLLLSFDRWLVINCTMILKTTLT
jgi:hypothetical protein